MGGYGPDDVVRDDSVRVAVCMHPHYSKSLHQFFYTDLFATVYDVGMEEHTRGLKPPYYTEIRVATAI